MEYEMKSPTREMSYEYMLPSSSWIENTDSHCLLLHVPGFKTVDVRIGADKDGRLTVTGERQTDGNKVVHFEQRFNVPENCDIVESSGIVEDGILYVSIPKYETPDTTLVPEKDKIQNNVTEGNDTEEKDEEEEESSRRADSADESGKGSVVEKISNILKENRLVVFTAFLAFSLGIVVSNRFQSTKKDKRKK